MKVYITKELTNEAQAKFSVLDLLTNEFKIFESKFYGEDLQHLYIGIFCMNAKFSQFFKPYKSKYRKEEKVYIHKGVQLTNLAGTFLYELRLDYEKYASKPDIREILANDVLTSLQEIKNFKKIKHFDFDSFEKDFKSVFERLNWCKPIVVTSSQ